MILFELLFSYRVLKVTYDIVWYVNSVYITVYFPLGNMYDEQFLTGLKREVYNDFLGYNMALSNLNQASNETRPK